MRPANIRIEFDAPIEMRDGVILYADIYRPEADGCYPVLLQRTPYDKSLAKVGSLDAIRGAKDGYAVVIQDVRGRYTSEGEFYTFVNESNDGYDTIESLAGEAWCTGKIGMYGGSYVGATQWLAALAKPPHLSAIAPAITSDDYYEGWTYQGGAFQLNFALSWALGLAAFNIDNLSRVLGDLSSEHQCLIDSLDAFADTAHFLPLESVPAFARDDIAPYYRDWVEHYQNDDYWQRWNIATAHANIDIPAYHQGGWYDIFLGGTLRNFIGMCGHAPTENTRNGQRLIIGPWMHDGVLAPKPGDVDFGLGAGGAAIDIHGKLLRWFDHWLKGVDNGVDHDPSIELFVMGVNQWRSETEWPLERAKFTEYYFHSEGNAATDLNSGTLTTKLPDAEPADSFEYDPHKPVPTQGGGLCCHNAQVPFGAFDQSKVEQRDDVVVYSTPPLDDDLEVTGPIRVILYAASSAPDTDFTAKLVDVSPCGRAINLTDGIVRARYRNSTEKAELLTPDEVYRYDIDLWATSNVFLKGHRIRIEITSSNFPRFDRNPNTGKPATNPAEFNTATQTIMHDKDYPTHVRLPVVPMDC